MCMVWFYKLFKFKVLNYVFLMTKACILYKFFGILYLQAFGIRLMKNRETCIIFFLITLSLLTLSFVPVDGNDNPKESADFRHDTILPVAVLFLRK